MKSAMERIKEIEGDILTLIDGSVPDRRWCNDSGYISAKPLRERYEFLLRSFKVMREIAIENIPPKERWEESNSMDEIINKFDLKFEERMAEEGK